MTGEHPRLILEDIKKQSRRLLMIRTCHGSEAFCWDPKRGATAREVLRVASEYCGREVTCPFAVGQKRYVKETWGLAAKDGFLIDPVINYKAGGGQLPIGLTERPDRYEAFCEWAGNGHEFRPGKWRSPRFMPRWAARTWIEITAVRLERLQQIMAADCLAEGVRIPCDGVGNMLVNISAKYTPGEYLSEKQLAKVRKRKPIGQDAWLIAHYAALWDTLNAVRGHGWRTNPWVWVVDFVRLLKPPVAFRINRTDWERQNLRYSKSP